eukprot:gene15723-17969_t
MGACSSKNQVADYAYNAKPSTISTEVSQQDISVRSALTQNIIKANDGKDIRDYYEIDHMPILGSGISGQVKICTHKATNMKYALKSLSKRAVAKEKLSRMKEEIRCMAYLDHPNILRVHEYFENKDVIYLILELCEGGELLDRLHHQQGHHYSEKVACRYIHTMLTAIAYCHANNVVHRDLKLENFLFENGSPQSELKLIDFGLSQYFKPKEIMHNSVGTPYYVAPEVLEGNYDAKCDVWSIGVIAFMLLSGTPPFYGRSDADTLNAVRLGRWHFDEYLFKPVSSDAKDFITKCLTRKPVLRPSAADALKHRWFNQLRSMKTEEERKSVSLQVVQRLDNFIKRTKLSKIIMDVVAHTLLPEQIADLRVQFTKFDKSESGQISLADMRSILIQFPGFQEDHLNDIFLNLDIDQTGQISYHEFLAATISRQSIKEENLQIAFERMSNRTSCITNQDIKVLLGNTNYDVDKIMEEVGLQAESTINFDQFKAIMNGGSVMPARDSPCRMEMRKAVFWKEGDSDNSPASVRDLSSSSVMNSMKNKNTINLDGIASSSGATSTATTTATANAKDARSAKLLGMHSMYHSNTTNTLAKNAAHNKDFTPSDISHEVRHRPVSIELAAIPPFSGKFNANTSTKTTAYDAALVSNNNGEHTRGGETDKKGVVNTSEKFVPLIDSRYSKSADSAASSVKIINANTRAKSISADGQLGGPKSSSDDHAQKDAAVQGLDTPLYSEEPGSLEELHLLQ